MSKGSNPRPFSVPMEQFNKQFDSIFGVTCKRCGKTGLKLDSVHTCTPQRREELQTVKENEQP